jgi:pimeloyl-ACP methyl ester carboxylesterase
MITRRCILSLLGAAPLAACDRPRSDTPPVDREEFVPAGGIEQWISIRGASAKNPALLFLHGGPGEAHSPFRSVFEPWERALTVVLWDQRGSGKTYGRNPSKPEDMSLKRLTQDAIEIAELARRQFGQDKLVLVGQSWGSMLAWSAARARPDLFHAYVGTGQAVSWAHTVKGQEAHARTQARLAGDRAAIDEMDRARSLAISSFERVAPFRRWIMPPSDLAYIEMQRKFVGPEPIPQRGDVADWVRGFSFSVQALGSEILAFDAYAMGLEMSIPVFVIQGVDDHVTPSEAAEQFVADLRAPAKAYLAIEGGHFACYTNAKRFAAVLEERILPLTA